MGVSNKRIYIRYRPKSVKWLIPLSSYINRSLVGWFSRSDRKNDQFLIFLRIDFTNYFMNWSHETVGKSLFSRLHDVISQTNTVSSSGLTISGLADGKAYLNRIQPETRRGEKIDGHVLVAFLETTAALSGVHQWYAGPRDRWKRLIEDFLQCRRRFRRQAR